MSCYLHQVPGRVRFRDARFKQEPERLERVVAALRKVAGVTEVQANPTTGSVTVCYQAKRIGPSRVIDVLAEHADPGTNLVGFPGLYAIPKRVQLTPRRKGLSPMAARVLLVSAKLVVPLLMERAFGRGGRIAATALIDLCS